MSITCLEHGGREASDAGLLTTTSSRIHRVAGLMGARTAVITTRPFRAPPQTISDVGLIGGGHLSMPGEVSRAHHGRLCLDARPECRRHGLKIISHNGQL